MDTQEMMVQRVERELASGRISYPRSIFVARDFGIAYDDKFDNTDPGDE
jgi:hypothetical protein